MSSLAQAAAPSRDTVTRYSMRRSLSSLLRMKDGDFSELLAMAETGGDVFFLRTPAGRFYFLNHPDLVQEFLTKHHRSFHRDAGSNGLKRLMRNGVLTAEHPDHPRQRRMILPAFHKDRINAYADRMVVHARHRGDQWHEGDRLDIHREMMDVTLTIISETMFRADIAADIDTVRSAVHTLLKYDSRYLFPLIGKFLDLFPLKSTREINENIAALDGIIHRFIRERRAAGGDTGDLLSMLLMAQSEDGGVGMDDEQVRDEVITLFLAGHETTAGALSWTWYLLSQHPEAAQRLHEEIDSVLEGGRAPTAADLPALAYTRRVLTESMRLYPPAYMFGRKAIADVQIGPYPIRKGENVIVSQWLMHRQARWYPEPERFDPDRWVPERAEALPKMAYFPFGGGARRCIGENFAWMESVLLLAAFAQHWHFELAPGARVAMQPVITLRPREGMDMIAHRREGNGALGPIRD